MRDMSMLYEVAKQVCLEHGIPWTDPRTGVTVAGTKKAGQRAGRYHPVRYQRKRKKVKRAKK